MGLARVLLDIVAVLLFLFVGVPLIVLLMGFMAPLWAGLYSLVVHTLGPSNPLSQVVYFLYQLSLYSHQYMVGSSGGSGSGSSGGACG